MTPSEQIAFYAEALQVRNIGSDEVDLVLAVEGLDIRTATIDECKEAIMDHQWIDSYDQWTWQTDSIELLRYLLGVRRKKEE